MCLFFHFRNTHAPLAVGLTVTLCHLLAIPYTGCGINPARSLGPGLISGQLDDHWVYWVGPMLGALVAAEAVEECFRRGHRVGIGDVVQLQVAVGVHPDQVARIHVTPHRTAGVDKRKAIGPRGVVLPVDRGRRTLQ